MSVGVIGHGGLLRAFSFSAFKLVRNKVLHEIQKGKNT